MNKSAVLVVVLVLMAIMPESLAAPQMPPMPNIPMPPIPPMSGLIPRTKREASAHGHQHTANCMGMYRQRPYQAPPPTEAPPAAEEAL